jgi:chaperone modulatory protein CbpM
MISETQLMETLGQLQQDALRRWIDLGFVRPRQEGELLRFDAADVVRVRLLCELHYDLRIEEDSLTVVLSLMDQLYAARRSVRTLISAIEAQPGDVRAQIATHVRTKP